MKTVIELLRKVLQNEYYCPLCKEYVSGNDVKCSYGHAYHSRCGTDVYSSTLLDSDEAMLKKALDILEDLEEKEKS